MAVTLGVAAVGAVAGGICGVVIVAALLVLHEGPATLLTGSTWEFLLVPAQFGAIAGVVGAPLTAWGLLRHVALGRAIAWTALGTLVGAVIGELAKPFNPYVRGVPALIAGGFVGFLVAAIVLRLRSGQRGRRVPDRAV